MIRVKVIVKGNDTEYYRPQLPDAAPQWGDCEFIFDYNEENYDWLVVYDDLPSTCSKVKKIPGQVELNCPPKQTLLMTMEPSNIKIYGQVFVEQFGYVLTSQESLALKHPNKIFSQPALRWFFGRGSSNVISYDELDQAEPYVKTKLLSSVCSAKQQKQTLHYKRYHFVQEIKKYLPEMDLFGHDVKEMDDKAESLTDYKYHVAIENHYALHHWTEKLSDAYLAYCLPIYYGCPNIEDYFPRESYILVDIDKPKEAAVIIKKAIENDEYKKRLPFIIEARNRVLKKYNMFAEIAKIISNHVPGNEPMTQNRILLSRHAARRRYPLKGMKDLFIKAKIQIRNRFIYNKLK